MSSQTLDMNTNMVHGRQYTFSFLSGVGIAAQIGGVIADAPTLTAALQADMGGYISSISVKAASDLAQQFLSDTQLDVTFVYTQAGADTVASISEMMLGSIYLSESSYAQALTNAPTFIGAYTGSFGTDSTPFGLPDLSVPSASSLWAIAILALLGVFVFSGGATATRAALA